MLVVDVVEGLDVGVAVVGVTRRGVGVVMNGMV